MKEPDIPKYTRQYMTTFMTDKYLAYCYVFDGLQYQDHCKIENPDGTYNISQKCLQRVSSRFKQFAQIGYDANASLSDDKGLVRYNENDQAVDFPNVVSALTHYWREVLLLCLFSAILVNLIIALIRRRHAPLFTKLFSFLGIKYFEQQARYSRLSATPTVDEQGKISVGKISFNPRVVLGYGSKGTCVFKGSFESKVDCAVKRVVSQYLTLADREVDFLRSLQHPNLVRYLATEEDAQFIYISLELAEFTLGELIESKRLNQIGLSKEELCRQAALGLQHLHKLDIVHRDIKPQNILVSFPMRPANDRKVMISDFGLSKQLSNLDTGHTSSAMRYFDGTQGWMAPEIVKAKIHEDKTLLPTKSADIFSLGCVFYYIIFEGQHPFGQAGHRQPNILENKSILEKFSVKSQSDLDVMASKLIRAMIQPEADDRPPINTVLKYPLFWSRSDQLQFLQDVSDRIDKEEKGSKITILVDCDEAKKKIFAYGWGECLGKLLQDDLRSFRKYNEKSVRHLLRAIRNKKHHYRELSDELKESLGDIPDGFMDYFGSRFPELLPHVYQAMQVCKHETIFRSYYEQTEEFMFSDFYQSRVKDDQDNHLIKRKKLLSSS